MAETEKLDGYFLALEKEAREPYYAGVLADGGLDADALDALARLRELRYGRKKKLFGGAADAFLSAMLDLLFINNQVDNGLGARGAQRELAKTGTALGLDEYASYGWRGREMFLREYKNAVRYFVELGKEDKTYSSGFLHLARLSDGKMENKFARDLGIMAYKLPRRFGLADRFAPFARGAAESFAELFPDFSRRLGGEYETD
jgi:hypothetical protein